MFDPGPGHESLATTTCELGVVGATVAGSSSAPGYWWSVSRERLEDLCDAVDAEREMAFLG